MQVEDYIYRHTGTRRPGLPPFTSPPYAKSHPIWGFPEAPL